MKTWAQQRGFTIVELLIVAVVIAILAAITVVAYRGIQNRAKDSVLQSAISQQAKKLVVAKATNNDQYPADFADARTQGALVDANGITYTAYIVSTDRTNYCATAQAADGSKYSMSSTASAPIAGECVTNLAHDPRATTYSSGATLGWRTGGWFGYSPAAGTYNPPVSGANDGPLGIGSYVRKTWSASPPSATSQGDTGFTIGASGTQAIPVSPGDMFAVSGYLRPSVVRSGQVSIYPYDSAGGSVTRVYGSIVSMPATSWTRETYIYAPAANVSFFSVAIDIANSATVWAPGNTLDGTALMITKGSSLYAYGDGNSSGWFWNGAPHNSTSVGPALAQ